MTLSIAVEPKDDHLWVTTSGAFELQRARGLISEIMDRASEQGLDRIVVDITGMSGYEGNSMMERFNIASFVAEEQHRGTRIAFLFSEKQILADNFDENVAVNRGGQVIVTTDIDKAFTWLGLVGAARP